MTTTPPDLERLFKSGIAAYKKGEYAQADTSFAKLSRCSSQTYRIKASMALARVYMAQQDWENATALCQQLSKNSKLSIQQWALNTLNKIGDRAESSSAQQISQSLVQSAKSNASGFQPLSPEPAGSEVSIFHYAYLNGEANESTEPAPAAQASAQQLPVAQPSAAQLSAETSPAEQTPEQTYEWPNAGRLSKGRFLGKMKRSPLYLSQMIGAAALFTLLLYLIRGAIAPINITLNLLYKLLPAWINLISTDYGYLAWRLAGGLLVIAIASPWLWDLWLRFTAHRAPFSIQKLRAISPEAATLVSQRCQQKRWPFPTLWKLPTEIPLIFSYGWLPRNARLVISEGLLSQLTADEVATLVSYEMAHWQTIYWPLLSLQGLLLQIFHQLYWQLALWGNQQDKPVSWIAGAVANLSYVIFWLLRIPGLWVSRVRTYYGDRAATEATGNPNGLTRALAKLSFGLASSIVATGYTPPIAESLALLLPVSADLARQSLYGSLPLAELFAWDSLNPLQNWMSIADAHPPLGDRLRLIMAYAQHWKLDLELPIASPPRRRQGLSQSEWARLIGQGMPFFGLTLGLAVGLVLLLLGAIGQWLKWPALDWMHQDLGLVAACMLMGIGLGTMLRINRFFPDLSFEMPISQDLPLWISDPGLLPISSVPAKLSGTLIGRPGLANWLGQDLIFKTADAGLLKLHFFSVLGPLGNVVSQQAKPTALIGKSVQVLGWFRRGNRPWLDIDRLLLNNGTLLQAAHPTTSLLVIVITSGLALWLLGFGQIFHETIDKIK